VYAQQEFHSLYQGDMAVGEYCGRLKRHADTLYDCGAAVSDTALVINTLRGLNNKFSQAIAVLTFIYTKSYLLHEENRIRHSLQMEAQTTLLVAAPNTSAPRPAAPSSSSSPAPTNPPNDRRKKRKAADARPRQNNSGQHAAHQPGAAISQPWVPPPNPWQGVVQAWPVNAWRPSLLGSRPGVHPPPPMAPIQAPSADAAFYAGAPGSLPPGLHTALNNMTSAAAAATGSWTRAPHRTWPPVLVFSVPLLPLLFIVILLSTMASPSRLTALAMPPFPAPLPLYNYVMFSLLLTLSKILFLFVC